MNPFGPFFRAIFGLFLTPGLALQYTSPYASCALLLYGSVMLIGCRAGGCDPILCVQIWGFSFYMGLVGGLPPAESFSMGFKSSLAVDELVTLATRIYDWCEARGGGGVDVPAGRTDLDTPFPWNPHLFARVGPCRCFGTASLNLKHALPTTVRPTHPSAPCGSPAHTLLRPPSLTCRGHPAGLARVRARSPRGGDVPDGLPNPGRD